MSEAVTASGSSVSPLAPDMRFGYSVDELAALLGALGRDGRAAYGLAELIDLGAYMWSYGAVLLVVLNALGGLAARSVGAQLLRTLPCWLAPAIVAADVLEDALQLLATAAYHRAVELGGGAPLNGLSGLPPWWQSVAAAASSVNQTKVRICVCQAKSASREVVCCIPAPPAPFLPDHPHAVVAGARDGSSHLSAWAAGTAPCAPRPAHARVSGRGGAPQGGVNLTRTRRSEPHALDDTWVP